MNYEELYRQAQHDIRHRDAAIVAERARRYKVENSLMVRTALMWLFLVCAVAIGVFWFITTHWSKS